MARFQSLDERDEYTEADRYGVQEVIDEIDEVVQPEEEYEEEEDFGDLSDVEIRLEEANCYKALLSNSLFEEPLSPIARRVERRIRSFIHTELKTLLGIEVVKVEPKLFSNDELQVLKALAAKVLSKNKELGIQLPAPVIEAPQAASVPQVKKTPSPEIPKVRKTRRPKLEPVLETRSMLSSNLDPVQPKQAVTQNPEATREVTLPNGLTVSGISAATQVRGDGRGGYPAISPGQEAAFYEQQVLTREPDRDILGLAIAAVNKHNASNPEE